MAKKKAERKAAKKMQNKSIAVGIIIIIILASAVFGVFDYNNKKENIKEVNHFLYNSLECISNCPITILLGNQIQSEFNTACTDKCREDYDLESRKLSGIKITDSRVIINSQEFLSCKNQFASDNNADRYKACLQKILPDLREKFNISL